MQFRRSGQRDERRRRVLSETVWHEGAEVGSERLARSADGDTERPARKSRNYGDAVFMDEQPRLTDLIPTRLVAYAGLFLAALAVVAGLEALYAWMPRLAPMTSDGRVAAFDLDGEGSLAVWFSSMTLAMAGLVAIVVYRVRQHRSDDYQGRYRIWLWAAACWFLLSLDETASLHEGFKEMMCCVTGTRLVGDGSMWWVAAYLFLLGGVGTRLLVDMRRCALSTTAMIAVACCYVVAVSAQLGWILPESGARGVMLEEGAEMVGNLMLLLAMGLHARHVILDAQGLLPEVPQPTVPVYPREKLPREPEEVRYPVKHPVQQPVKQPVVVHPPHGALRPAPSPGAALAAEIQTEREALGTSESPENIETSGGRKLTKAERKALRRRLRQMAMERQRRESGS